jgi:RimJ/RimL family protein N-acetyltransferase
VIVPFQIERGIPEVGYPRRRACNRRFSLSPMAAQVKLRDFRPADAPAVHGWFNDARVTADLVGSRDLFTLEDAAGWIERALDTSRDRKWAITIDGSDDAVGFVALFGLDRETGPELAVLVGEPSAWGKGVAREAERQACNRAFSGYGAHRIHAEIPATNVAAQKVVTFLGFQREGVMRAAIRRGQETIDNQVWGLLPKDFKGWDTKAKPS